MKNKKILVGALAAIVLIILIITGICIDISKSKNAISISTPELARVMNYEQFEDGDEAIDNTDNVKFSAFFLRDLDGDGYAEKIKGTCRPIGEEDALYMEINVQTEGYLKDAKIEIAGQNFYLQTALPKDEQLKDNYIGNNIKTIEFNQLNNGTQKLLTGIVRSGDYSYTSTKASAIGNNINNYSRTDNKVILTGTYVGENGTETEISKEVPLTVDWYGTTKATISSTSQTYNDLPSRIDEENGTIKLGFTINTGETNNTLNLSKNHVEGTIPSLNGYVPTKVTMKNITSENLIFVYNYITHLFTIDRIATVAEDGTITTSISRSNSYEIEVTYPIEAYQSLGEDTATIKIPVRAYYEGYNNSNTEFTNPYESNTASATIVANYSNPQGTVANFAITVGKNIYQPTSRYIVSKEKALKLYNGTIEGETDDIYTVRWYAYTGTDGETSGLVMKETKTGDSQVSDEFINTSGIPSSMENVTTNVGIYFTGADNILKEDGWIKVYDEETDNLLVTFTKDNWGTYTSSNPYKYELPVKHIKVETSETNKESALYVYNIKELDDEYITTNYTKEEFENLQYIKSTLNGYLGENYIRTVTHQADYEAPFSVATISLSNNNISTQSTEENEKITITTEYNMENNQLGWGSGSFLVKLPEEILVLEINSVEVNNSNITIVSYEVIENDVGKFIKINTENSKPISQSYKITIDVDITPDPRIATTTGTIELYASNDQAVEYYYKGQDIYDVNDNLNTTEIVNKTTTSISLVSPNSLLTNQTASEYDSKNSMIISPQIADITPLYAKVDNEKQTAKIGVQLKNNYASTISEVVILGKIPFEGNTTVVGGKDLESKFTTKILNTGIEIPEELQGKVTIYYSENEAPDKDLTNAENGWQRVESVTNWDNIKTFLIDFEDEVIAQGKEYTFYYKVEIPEGVEFNKVTYSHHGIYFCLDTDEGKYRTQTEPNKLGFRIAEKFHLEIIKTQTGKDKSVAGATYSIKEIPTDGTTIEAKTAVTNEQGTLIIKNLYAERTYEIQEIKTPDDYELNTDIIRIIGHVAEDGTLTIEKLQGTTKEDIVVTKNNGEKHKVTVKVEDEAKARLKITKKEQGTEKLVSRVTYRLTGAGLPQNGRVLATNVNGEINIRGLKVNEEYTLEEIKAIGYYLSAPIKFKIENNEGNYELKLTEGTVAQSNMTEEDSLPIANLTLENEKIPTYNLEISKIKKMLQTELNTEDTAENTTGEQEIVYLQGAKFKLYKGTEEIGTYTTGVDGKIIIENLYQYIEGKDENATYTLKEVIAPDGYAKVKDITFKVEAVDGTLTLINTNGEEEKYTVEGATVKLTIEDSPSFKLIKKDAETGEVLANVKFAIYNIDEGTVPATNSKGEIIGAKETINGREYYTVTTDSNGVITADLPEGYYKAVEVQAPDKYNIENSTYYFGIGGSREGRIGVEAEWAKSLWGGTYIYSISETSDGGHIAGGTFGIKKYNLNNQEEWSKSIGTVNSVSETRDGGYIVGGTFGVKKYTMDGQEEWTKSIGTVNSVSGTSNGGYIVGGTFGIKKYTMDGQEEWSNSIKQNISGANNTIKSVVETNDGEYIVGGYFNWTIDLGNGVTLNNGNTRYYDSMIIKYNNNGIAQWAKAIHSDYDNHIYSVAATCDGGYIVGGDFDDTINLENGVTLNGSYDGMLIKYSADGVIEWARSIGESRYDKISSISQTSDGGYIVGGSFEAVRIDLGNGVSISNFNDVMSNGVYDGMLIKYNGKGEAEWAHAIGGSKDDYITSVSETSDGNYIIGGYYASTSIELGNIGSLTTSNSSNTAMVIKYKTAEKPEVVIKQETSIQGYSNNYVDSISETRDGGHIAAGYFEGSIDMGNGVILSSNGDSDGMLIKYNITGIAQWAKNIGGSSGDYIESVVETSDGGYIVGGYFESSSINLGNEISLTNHSMSTSSSDGMLIKYSREGEVEWAKSIGGNSSDYIESVVETSDGGYIVGGYFAGNNIDLENGVSLINNSMSASSSDGMLIKYSREGKVEWAKSIGGNSSDYIESVVETSDGGYIVGGYFESSSINLENGVELSNNGYLDGMLIKYNSNVEAQWAKKIGGSKNDYIKSVAETINGTYIVGGYFESAYIYLENGRTLTYTGNSYHAGMVIRYSANGEIEWLQSISTDGRACVNSVAATRDGAYIVGGYFNGGRITIGNGETLNNNNYYNNNRGMAIKYTEEGYVEWSKAIGEGGRTLLWMFGSRNK